MRAYLLSAVLALVGATAHAQDAYVAPDGRTVAQLIADHVLPDPTTTPGVLNPAVTPATLTSTICCPPGQRICASRTHWIKAARPPTSYTNPIKAKDTPAGQKEADGELDHLVSIEDGGSPTDPANLWWMAYNDRYGARVKDVLETKLSHMVCAGKLSIGAARNALSPNWLIGYTAYVGQLPK